MVDTDDTVDVSGADGSGRDGSPLGKRGVTYGYTVSHIHSRL